MYDIKYLKDRGFFQNSAEDIIEFHGRKLKITIDGNNGLAYVEIENSEKIEDIKRIILENYKGVKYIWFFSIESDGNEKYEKIRVFRRYGEIRWFYYSSKIRREEYKKSKEDKLRQFSPQNVNVLFDIRDVVNKFYNSLLKQMIDMAKRVKKLKSDGNKLMLIQSFVNRLIFFYFVSQLGLVRIELKNGEKRKSWTLNRTTTRDFFEDLCKSLKEDKKLLEFLNEMFFDVFGKVTESGWNEAKFKVGEYEFYVVGPSLNGGLFIEKEFEGYKEREIEFSLIKDLILNILNKYNWIIGEEVPYEEDVIGDLTPEIIGHIYEKLVVSLEQIDVEKISLKDFSLNQEELRYGRKKIGAYYTPEEITNYISKNTIFPYIKDRLLEKFGRKGKEVWKKLFSKEKKFDSEELEIIKYLYFEILTKMKICDNACGSGSFLMAAGDILLRLYSRTLKILKNYLSEDENVKRVLDEMRNSPSRNYYIVRQIIVNNLYGVDIMEGAVEIAKLRLWLWLVSQLDPRKVEGRKIETLPNLDFNIMFGNSLIGFVDIEDIDFSRILGRQRTLKEFFNVKNQKIEWLKSLAKKRQEFKTLPSHEAVKKKEELNKELNTARDFLNEEFYKMLRAKGVDITEEDFLKLKPFHWGFEFYEVFDLEKPKEERGFDIIIGNPPYVRQENINDIVEGINYKMILSKLYDPFENTFDFSMFFILRSLQLCKKKGYHSFIITNKWLRAKYGKKIRKFLKENVTIKKVIDFNGIRVFVGATVDTMIYIVNKEKPNKDNKIFYNNPTNLEEIEEGGYYVKQFNLEDDVWNFIDERILEIKKWVEKVGTPLKYLNVKIYRGILTGLNEAFIIDDETRKKLIEEDPKSEELIKPVLRGRDIGRYHIEWNKLYLIYSYQGINIENYPAIKKHLESYKKELSKRTGGAIRKGNQVMIPYKWYELQVDYKKSIKEFEKPKIVWQEIVREPSFYLESSKMYCEATSFIMTSEKISLKLLLFLLNSKISWFAIKLYGTNLGEDTARYKKAYIEKIPIRLPKITKPYETIADYLLFLNATEERRQKLKETIEFFDSQIADSLVYELYFKEKFVEDGLYPEPKEYLLETVSKHLKPINYDRWAELYWKKQIEGNLTKNEQKELEELERENLETIMEVFEKIKNDEEIMKLIEKIKNHRWIEILERGKK